MSDAHGLLRGLHLPAAFLALATFWGAVLARKGGRLHLRFGRLFASSMVVTAATAALMCLMLMAGPLVVRGPSLSRPAQDRAPRRAGHRERSRSPLFLQPLLENAVRHGVAPRVEGGRIEVGIRRGEGVLCAP